jgi:hypothetical protein
MGMKIATDRDKMTCDLLNYQSASADDLSKISPEPEFVRENARVLDHYQLNVFHDRTTADNTMRCKMNTTYPDQYNHLFLYLEKLKKLAP